MDIETKNLIDQIVSGFVKILKLDSFTFKISQFIKNSYSKGIEGAEQTFNMNFLPQESDVNFLSNYVNQNIDDVADDVGKQLRQELSRGLLAGDDIQGIKDRVKEVFGSQKFTERLKTVIRTEGIRAENQGSLSAAKQSNLKLKKYVIIVDDKRTSPICHAEDRKYGTESEAIPLDEQFVVRVDNKTIKAQAPPFHVNCRSTLGYVKVEEEDEE